MGRKDAERFKKIEDRLADIELEQTKMLRAQDEIIEKHQKALIQLRDIYNKLIQGD